VTESFLISVIAVEDVYWTVLNREAVSDIKLTMNLLSRISLTLLSVGYKGLITWHVRL
jgi:hypothetical protein